MPLIIVCYLFAFFDRINISFAKTGLQTDLGLSNVAYAFGASLFVVGYVLFEVPSNLLLYRYGPRRWIAQIIIAWGLATASMVFIWDEWQFYGLRFLVGAMEAGFAPGIIYYLTLWFPKQYRGRMTSTFFLATAFSGIIGAPISGMVLNYTNGAFGLEGWRWLFLLGGLPSVALGAIVLIRFDDRVEDAAWLEPNERRMIARQLREQKQLHKQPQDTDMWSLLRGFAGPHVLLLGLIYFLIQLASYGLNFWGPDLIKSAGSSNSALLGLLTAVPYVCGAITMIVIGRMSDRTGERAKFVAGLILASAAGFFAAGYFDQHVVLVIGALAIIGAGVLAAIPAFWNLPPKIMTGVDAAGGIALINTLGQLGGIVSPSLIGLVKDYSGSTAPALYAIGGLCVLCGLLVLFALPQTLTMNDRVATS